ncbi:MAG: GNAT family N-acetyltransferase [Chloroflexi bacterium]|nr:GNAT family N-acetyltransferase [Chloroflexota bacterium]
MQISINQWHELDLHEIAHLTYAAKEADRQTDGEAVERIVKWLREQFAELPRLAVLARSEERLVGWMMLVVQNPSKVEINPWYLGGHPLVAPSQDRHEVGLLLLQKAIEWARNEGYEVIELCIARDLTADPQVYKSVNDWYTSLGFRVREESVGFFHQLSSLDLPTLVVPEGIEIRLVTEVDQDELYRCYHDTMTVGQSRFFFDQSETERRAYFDTFGKTYGRHEATSLVLVQNEQIVGFSYTIPFGKHLHLDWIGIHPDVRRRGLGRFLMLMLMERAVGGGFQTMGLNCDTRNTRAIALYRSLGWQQEDAELKYAAKL